jgi:uracil phosphoribosyltransferase
MAPMTQSPPNLQVLGHPLIQDKLSRARGKDTPTPEFRRLLHEIAALMAYEVAADLPTEDLPVETPLETMQGPRITAKVTLVPILRAGLGMTEGIRALIPDARVGHVGLYRDDKTLEPVSYYEKLPADVADSFVLVVDPMLATGGSASAAVQRLKDKGCDRIRLVCLVAAPEGVLRMYEQHPDVRVHAAALDRQLDERGYILPGLGDAGDRIFGTL